MEASDPDVLRAGTNHIPLPGDGRQQQRIRAVTRDLNGNEEEDRSSEAGETTSAMWQTEAAKEKRKKGSGMLDEDSLDSGQLKNQQGELRERRQWGRMPQRATSLYA
ncbi:hypothetical protein NDU88_001127 [Pleurodeles waltl]|uniref:Uncharacterized protein n=1 Tax=Pleurodeles waltl TaxID=8319 RepID=A0AAV7TH02_PLEWA|nr:hypothetical protein NDU88_001127 [Pleurodeles waltl]